MKNGKKVHVGVAQGVEAEGGCNFGICVSIHKNHSLSRRGFLLRDKWARTEKRYVRFDFRKKRFALQRNQIPVQKKNEINKLYLMNRFFPMGKRGLMTFPAGFSRGMQFFGEFDCSDPENVSMFLREFLGKFFRFRFFLFEYFHCFRIIEFYCELRIRLVSLSLLWSASNLIQEFLCRGRPFQSALRWFRSPGLEGFASNNPDCSPAGGLKAGCKKLQQQMFPAEKTETWGNESDKNRLHTDWSDCTCTR